MPMTRAMAKLAIERGEAMDPALLTYKYTTKKRQKPRQQQQQQPCHGHGHGYGQPTSPSQPSTSKESNKSSPPVVARSREVRNQQYNKNESSCDKKTQSQKRRYDPGCTGSNYLTCEESPATKENMTKLVKYFLSPSSTAAATATHDDDKDTGFKTKTNLILNIGIDEIQATRQKLSERFIKSWESIKRQNMAAAMVSTTSTSTAPAPIIEVIEEFEQDDLHLHDIHEEEEEEGEEEEENVVNKTIYYDALDFLEDEADEDEDNTELIDLNENTPLMEQQQASSSSSSSSSNLLPSTPEDNYYLFPRPNSKETRIPILSFSPNSFGHNTDNNRYNIRKSNYDPFVISSDDSIIEEEEEDEENVQPQYDITMYEDLKDEDKLPELRQTKQVPTWVSDRYSFIYDLYSQNPEFMSYNSGHRDSTLDDFIFPNPKSAPPPFPFTGKK